VSDLPRLRRTAFPLVLAAPSGTGKTTIAQALVEREVRFVFSVSVTTRRPRPGEVDGVDYRFVSPDRFRALAREGELVEWAEVHGHRYGTPRDNLEAAMREGRHTVLDIDVQGARQIRERVPEAVLVFVFPPSARALVRRLQGRATEPDPEVLRRLRNGREELGRIEEFDYVVVNDVLERAVDEVRGIVDAERLRPQRTENLAEDVERLRREIDEVVAAGASEGE